MCLFILNRIIKISSFLDGSVSQAKPQTSDSTTKFSNPNEIQFISYLANVALKCIPNLCSFVYFSVA